MAIRLSNLFEETRDLYELQLIAGSNGLHRELNWVYVAEDQSNASFLRTGELIISTGALYNHTEEWLLRFVHTLSNHHTCGLILNTGKHIFPSDITASVRDFCDNHDFPLFIMPWHIHIYDITKDYYDRIFMDMRSEHSLDFYRLLSEIENKSILEKYVNQKLGTVLAYDEKHHSNLADTLFLYLKHWGNIQKIAEESYCHRNTVTNRIRILQEQLGCHLNDPAERFELMTAFMIRESHILL
ncbi:MAG: PucR family transcriptional regulator ligand-binding domain-containing protein [Eubacterium sp.]|nr:PucR family transcriptional regulator ligand-binding domain-containing protein [Eubacterium sp.]